MIPRTTTTQSTWLRFVIEVLGGLSLAGGRTLKRVGAPRIREPTRDRVRDMHMVASRQPAPRRRASAATPTRDGRAGHDRTKKNV